MESGVTVWMELVDSSAIQGNIRAEIFESPAEDSIWMDYSGVQPIEGEILHTVTARDGNRIVFAPDNRLGNEFKPPSVLEGFKYLVHVYSDEDDFKIYWTFTTKSPDMGFTFTDTLMMHEDQPVDGKTVYLKIVEHSTVEGDGEGALTGIDFGDIEDPAVYWTSATMRDDSVSMMLNGEVEWADFSISGIAQGDYSLWAFIDMNGNATNDNSTTPDSGDLWKGVENFGFYSREIVSEWKHLLNELAWQQY